MNGISYTTLGRCIYLFLASTVYSQLSTGNELVLPEKVQTGYEIDIPNLSGVFPENAKPVILNSDDPGVASLRIERQSASSGGQVRLRVTDEIDREKICPKTTQTNQAFDVGTGVYYSGLYSPQSSMLPQEEECRISLRIIAEGVESVHSVVVTIQDINDNNPKWPNYQDNDIIEIEFKDGDPKGTLKILPLAQDADSGLNAFITYRLMPLRDDMLGYVNNEARISDYFELVKINDESRSSHDILSSSSAGQLALKAKTALDREENPDGWKVSLVATDSGLNHPLSGSLILKIKLIDINDVAPKFSRPSYEADRPVREDTPVDTTVIQVHARDEDSGEYGRIRYELIGNEIALRYFEITKKGEIRIRQKLQVDKDSKNTPVLPTGNLVFKVKAIDGGPGSYALSGEAVVTLRIEDVNDEFPAMSIHAVKKPSENMSSGAFVRGAVQLGMEEEKPEQLIALLDVTDADQGGKDPVDCKLEGPNASKFRLQRRHNSAALSQSNEYELRSATKWDREETSRVELFIECKDSSDHLTKQVVDVLILDVNDNDPRCTNESGFLFKIQEEDGENVATRPYYGAGYSPLRPREWSTHNRKAVVVAKDLDDIRTNNAKLEYRLESSSQNPYNSEEQVFEINKETGELNPVGRLDREVQADYVFNVVVSDLGEPPRSTICKVEIEVIDLNDNAPEFLPLSINELGYNFEIEETNSIGTVIGRVSAIDKDLMDHSEYSALAYSFQDQSATTLTKDANTHVGRHKGLYFALDHSDDASFFRIDPHTGVIRTQ
ncbi:hypothetical protein Ciccas_001215 [Cichlidogyrus casuarinus]|uniref:Cadherin domain-containing protein n=1 Tax=Cichlidogyrus casuarinus TaxID=1844966 RepID=A0ABD2QKQ2_9PLAT